MMNKDEIKSRILTVNTAQAIHKRLKENESNRARMQERWIWELLQNARDASTAEDASLVARVEFGDGEIVFQHNGRGFTPEEVGHLIYHGSTKVEDDKAIGQYGSGFLTTHLLSPEIDVSGQLDNGRPFNFLLKREISSVKTLSDSMDKAWDDFHAYTGVPSAGFTTQFRYPLGEDSANAVEEGIKALQRYAPFVLVFNPQFQCITIESPSETANFEVIERTPLQKDGLQMVIVKVSSQGLRREHRYILAEGTQTSVSVPVERIGDGYTCLRLDGTPRLFLGFPLVGTEHFSFPAVINSFNFTPTENRDGVYLGQSNDTANETNKSVIVEACKLHIQLIEFMANAHWKSIHSLVEIPPISPHNWLNPDWLREQLASLIALIRQTPTILSERGPMTPQEAIVPAAGSDNSVEVLWNLLDEIESIRHKLPKHDEAASWHNAIKTWGHILKCESTSFEEILDGGKLVAYIEESPTAPGTDYHTLDGLQDMLRSESSAVEWLTQLYSFLKGEGLDSLIRERPIILDQIGCLDRLVNLYRDIGIDESLKDIADMLDLKVRHYLRDKRLTSLANEPGKGSQADQDIIPKIIDSLKNQAADSLTHELADISARMLAWILTHDGNLHYLTNYPAPAWRRSDNAYPVLWFNKPDGLDPDIPLAPVPAWPVNLQEFASLFPVNRIISRIVFDLAPDPDIWRKLSEQGYIRMDVIINSDNNVERFLPDEPLTDGDHNTIDTVPVTDLAFLTKDRIGIMERVRNSQDRARLFWRFLTEWLIVNDVEGLEEREANCSCGEAHKYYPANWLVPVVENRWVPQGDNRRDRATPQSLARLLRDSDWTPASLTEGTPALRLLDAMEITRLDLMKEFIVNDDESRTRFDNAMTSILVSTGGDLSYVNDFLEDMKTDREIVTHLAERRNLRRMVHENQKLGEHVEYLVKEALESEGFAVKRTHIGSDFEIEYDLTEGDMEIGIELSRSDRRWLVEVKATRDQRVRMTPKQAETAVHEGPNFLLCVVPIRTEGPDLVEDCVRADMRFVQNIGSRVEPLCSHLDDLNDLRDDTPFSGGEDIELEIQAGTARIRVDSTVWQDGISLKELFTRLI